MIISGGLLHEFVLISSQLAYDFTPSYIARMSNEENSYIRIFIFGNNKLSWVSYNTMQWKLAFTTLDVIQLFSVTHAVS